MVITRDNNASPDVILTAFDGKVHDKKDELPPKACRPSKKLKQNNVEKVDSQKVEKKQCRQSGFIYFHIQPYTSIYFKYCPYTFIYPHIPPYTSKYLIFGQLGPT